MLRCLVAARLLILAVVVGACGASDSKPIDPEITAQVKPMVLAPGWVTGSTWPTQTVVALNSVAMRTSAHVDGDVAVITASTGAVLQNTAELYMASNAEITGAAKADSMEMLVAAHVFGAASYNGLTGTGTIDGTKTPSLTVPQPITIVAAATFSAGSTNITVSAGNTTTINAGNYATWTLNTGTGSSFAVLRLNSGTYNVNQINCNNYGRIECNGTCEVRVKSRVFVGTNAYLGVFGTNAPNMTAMKLFVEGTNGVNTPTGTPAAAAFGSRSELKAFTFVPNGTLSLSDNVVGIGKFIAKDVDIGASSDLMTGTTTQRVSNGTDRWVYGSTWPPEVVTSWNSVDFLSSAVLTGNISVLTNASTFLNGAEAAIGSSARVIGTVSADRITLASGSNISVGIYNTISNSGTVGTSITPLSLPVRVVVPVFPIITSSSSNYTLGGQLDATLAAGRFRDVTLNAGISSNKTVLTLSGGVYEMRRLTTSNYSQIICTAACEIRIKDRLIPGNFVQIGPGPGLDLSNVKIFAYRNDTSPTDTPYAVTFGTDSSIEAMVFAPRGNMEAGARTTMRGRFIANNVRIGSGGTSTRSGATELPPSIQVQPMSQTVVQGTAVTFSVQATGTDIAFQWKRNGTNISGATSGSYTIASPVLADSGASFTVQVSNTANGTPQSVTSSAAILTVHSCAPMMATPTMCGVGVCQNNGWLSCVNGTLEDSCMVRSTMGTDNDCDGLDDDCDGSVDEAYVPMATTCGMGACMATGTTSCVAGMVQNSCLTTTPAANDATCDGRDDDCNGQVDEDFVSYSASCGVGACLRNGLVTCSGGSLSHACTPGNPGNSDTDCDGVDDDCDGEADQDYDSRVTSCGAGACASSGETDCVNGVETDSCVAGTNAPTDTTCNGVDDNCNGQVDEGYVGAGIQCGTGACQRNGTNVCISGSVQASCTPGSPTSDANCNNLDDDCDGPRDEHYVSVVTSCGSSPCLGSGATSCVSGNVQDSCTPPTTDTDSDGTYDCADGCPNHAAKTAPGQCGCAAADTDGDGDGIANCVDTCPLDPANDVDVDGICGDLDNCPTVANAGQENQDGDEDGDACDAPPAVASTTGGMHTCALLDTKEVGCWGANSYGQLGNGTTSSIPLGAPVMVSGLTDAEAVAAGYQHTCALLGGASAGTIKCWGRNNKGQLGNASTTSSSTPVLVSGISNASHIAAGNDHTCARLLDNTVKCWGGNATRQLGDNTAVTQATTPVTVSGLTDATGIGAGTGFSCALRTGGLVSCWGTNSNGQIGSTLQALAVNAATPVQVENLADAWQLSVGGLHACVRRSTGALACWGWNEDGQLGDASNTDARSPVAVSGISDATTVSAGLRHSCTRRSTGALACWGSNSYGQIGNGTFVDTTAPSAVTGLSDAQDVTVGDTHSCALRSSGEINCWGDAENGQLGGGATDHSYVPRTVIGITTGSRVAVGEAHVCAALTGQTVRCWGLNHRGQLGDGSDIIIGSAPVTVSGLSNVVELSAGSVHSCARTSSGSVQCWGEGAFGQMGNGATADQLTPVAVSGLIGVTAIEAGRQSTCALLSTGAVRCWGRGDTGQLGNNGTANASSPVAVSGISTATAISVGTFHACAVLSDNTVSCWGQGADGQLGDGGSSVQLTPVAVNGVTDAVAVAAANRHTCALRSSGAITCWGEGSGGELGDGAATDSLTPVAVSSISNATRLSGGFGHTCALLSNNQVRCWGRNQGGQIGDASTTTAYSPQPVSNLFDAIDASAGDEVSCGVRSGGQLRCWGTGTYGELGNGYPASALPARVLW